MPWVQLKGAQLQGEKRLHHSAEPSQCVSLWMGRLTMSSSKRGGGWQSNKQQWQSVQGCQVRGWIWVVLACSMPKSNISIN